MDPIPQKACPQVSLLKELVQLLLLLLILLALLFFISLSIVRSVCKSSVYAGIGGVIIINIFLIAYLCNQNEKRCRTNFGNQQAINNATVEAIIAEAIKEKPIRFTAHQLRIATDHYNKLLGTGAFGSVFQGCLVSGVPIAVKLLSRETREKKMRDQFFAEVSTIGTTNHVNLVRLYGFCFDKGLLALVYEYMENGSLDQLLFNKNKKIEWKTLYEIAIGSAKGIAYLHEECENRIIHYDIKPANILLDANFHPKVADFGLARLSNRDKSHITLSGFKGTPGYAAPELWMPSQITHKCDIYSYGMVLFEILGKRKNLSTGLPESQEWFPTWIWKKYEEGKMAEVIDVCGIDGNDTMAAEKMAMIAMWCVQFRPEKRPSMSVVANMLEGVVEIPTPSYPFKHNANEILGANLEAVQLPQ